MDDVMKLQRVNKLAKELLDHHMVETSDEGYRRAKLMVMGEREADVQKKEVEEEKTLEFNQEIRVLDTKIHILAKEVKEIKDAVENLVSEVSKIKDSVSNRPVLKTVEVVKEFRREPVKEEDKKISNFANKDVSIEKMFYFGKK